MREHKGPVFTAGRKEASNVQRDAAENLFRFAPAASAAHTTTWTARWNDTNSSSEHGLVVVSRWDDPECLRRRYKDVDIVLAPYGTLKSSLPHGVTLATQFEATAQNCSTRMCAKEGLPPLSCTGFFGGSSGWAKLAFVVWLATSAHDHAWHIEDDTVSIAGWRALARRYQEDESDLIAQFQWNPKHAFYKDWKKPPTPGCSICAERVGLTAWPLLRMSRHLARAVLYEVLQQEEGHHEVFVLAACYRLPRCRWRFLDHAKEQLIISTPMWNRIPPRSRVATRATCAAPRAQCCASKSAAGVLDLAGDLAA